MKRVITYGTFDLFHRGHYNILKRARALGDYLIVGVTSESYDIERGKLNVRDSLLHRIENVRKTGFADEIIIEEYQGQKVSDILKYNIDVLVLGSDWRGKFDYLKNYCEVVYLERTKNISSTQLRGEGRTFNIGVVTDSTWDGGIVWESKYVSGLHTERVCSENEQTAQKFCEKYELDTYGTDFASFVSDVEVVYVHVKEEDRAEYVSKCLYAGRHVICDAPITRDPSHLRELFDLAARKQIILFERITLAYLRAFNQLVWQAHAGLIGRILSVKCTVSAEFFEGGKDLPETAVYPLCAVIKLLGSGWTDIQTSEVEDEGEDCAYKLITIRYPEALACIEIGSGLDMENEFVVLGSNGRITIPNDWWNTGYFEARVLGADPLKRFCFNFEGNGLRYLLQEMMIMMSDRRTTNARLFSQESVELTKMLQKIL
ncbi:MAG: adenylyltransferase/cytidyltransferase family protein [Blautia sp.]|nr:adenylyltransferase/cytidyltransferase family protein [Blautia sp.]